MHPLSNSRLGESFSEFFKEMTQTNQVILGAYAIQFSKTEEPMADLRSALALLSRGQNPCLNLSSPSTSFSSLPLAAASRAHARSAVLEGGPAYRGPSACRQRKKPHPHPVHVTP